jgi:hypothetical protein
MTLVNIFASLSSVTGLTLTEKSRLVKEAFTIYARVLFVTQVDVLTMSAMISVDTMTDISIDKRETNTTILTR